MTQPVYRPRGMIPDALEEVERDHRFGLVVAPRFGSPSAAAIEPTMTLDDVDAEADSWPCLDQGLTLYCTRYAICSAMTLLDEQHIEFSPHYLAWMDAPTERAQNLGQAIVTSAHAAARYGVCSWMAHPSETLGQRPEHRVGTMPQPHAHAEAERHQVLAHYRIEDGDVATCYEAVQRGESVVFGVYLRAGFYAVGESGLVRNEGTGAGWHAMLLRGFTTIAGQVVGVVRNSYGGAFGRRGYVLLTLDEMAKARDLRVLRSAELSPREVIRAS